ncbi:MAG TPA: DUF2200 family protein [Pyrinomonadaceae bacterium]|nr:DUF2200 family protein [Pyrinomonadaceae bacterium]
MRSLRPETLRRSIYQKRLNIAGVGVRTNRYRRLDLHSGVVCGVRVENIEDRSYKNSETSDKLVDELAEGKKMEKILRKPVL